MVTVKTILKKKSFVASISKESQILEAAFEMSKRNIGSLVVTDQNNVVGIFTERDCLKKVVAEGKDPKATKIKDVMTSPVAVCHPETSIEECKAVMTEKRIRHLPVVSDGRLEGIITIGDITALEAACKEKTIEYLNEYIYGPFDAKENFKA